MKSERKNMEVGVPDLNDSRISAHRWALPPCFQSSWNQETQPSINSFESVHAELKASLGPVATNLLFEAIGKQFSNLEAS